MLPSHMADTITKYAANARLLERYRQGSRVFEGLTKQGQYVSTGKTPFGFAVYYIPALSEDQDTALPGISIDHAMLEDPQPAPLAFRFDVQVQMPGKSRFRASKPRPAKLMMDTGATTRFASERWVLANGFTINPSHANWSVQVANSDTMSVSGTVDLEVMVQGFKQVIRFLVIPMAEDMDLIIGNDWLHKHKAVLDYEQSTVSFWHNGKRLVLQPTGTQQSVKRVLEAAGERESEDADSAAGQEGNVQILNFAKAKKIIRDRDDWMVLQLHHVAGSDQWTDVQFMAAKAKMATPEEQEADIRAAIQRLKDEVAANQAKSKVRTTDPQYNKDSEELDKKVVELVAAWGTDVFRTELPGIRDIGEPMEAIPTIPGKGPVTRGMFRYTQTEKEELQKHITTLLKDGMIEPSRSPWAASALVVPKWNPDGTIKGWRLVIDYRLVNAITVRFQYPMPRIDDVLDSVGGARFFSSCDLTSGFWQLRLTDSDVPKTAFRTPTGLYQWRVLPMGLSNSPAVFQRTMSEVFQREFTKPDGTKIMALGNFIQVYMDDLLIYSKTAEEHLAHLEFIFEALYEHGFYLNPKKCEFNKPEVRFLGHIISQEGCKVDPCKVETMNEWREPTTGKEMYSFLGFANYFRQFIRDYATIAAPLHELVHMKKFGDKWTDLHRACFEAIKLALANAPTLKMPDFQSPFEVIVDASNVAIGAVLVQQDRPVAYESKKLTDTQKRWTTTERELWAAVHALKTWRCYLQHPSFKFDLWTDHNPNTFFSTGNTPLSARQARWAELIAHYNFQWRYKKGKDNIADALSRLPEVAMAMVLAKLECWATETRAQANARQRHETITAAVQRALRSDPPGGEQPSQGEDLIREAPHQRSQQRGRGGRRPVTGRREERLPSPPPLPPPPPLPTPPLQPLPHQDRRAPPVRPAVRFADEIQEERIRQPARAPIFVRAQDTPAGERQVQQLRQHGQPGGGEPGLGGEQQMEVARNPPIQATRRIEAQQGRPSGFQPHGQLTEFQSKLKEAAGDQWFVENAAKTEYKWVQDARGLWVDSSGKLVIPPGPMRTEVMEACHDSVFSGHFGRAKTEGLISRMFYWPYMAADIQKYVAECDTCQRVKANNRAPQGGLQPLPVAEGKWLDISVDMITELPCTEEGYDAIMVFVDRLTKMVHFVPCKKTLDSKGFCQMFMDHIVRLHGWPKRVVSDRGSIFTSHFTAAVAELQGWFRRHSSAYHPQSDGQTERVNRVLEDVLRSFVSTRQREWKDFLAMAEFAVNNSVHPAIHTTPFLLNYGVNPRHPEIAKLVEPLAEYILPQIREVPAGPAAAEGITRIVRANVLQSRIDPSKMPEACLALRLWVTTFRETPAATRFVRDMERAIRHTQFFLEAARQRMRQVADPRRTTNVPLAVGDWVLLSTKNIKVQHGGSDKLFPRFLGPFRIVQEVNPVAFRLELPTPMRIHPVFHASLLRKYKPRRGQDGEEIVTPPPAPMVLAEGVEFKVDMILGDRDKEISVRTNAHGVPNRRIQKEYLVKWVGYTEEHNQWIAEAELEAFRPVINEYLAIKAQAQAAQQPALQAAMLWHQKVKWG
jgi:transposase InsO family protein